MPCTDNDYVIITVFKHCLLYNIRKTEGVISSIIIDGYNLIGIYHKDLEKQRRELIDALVEYRKNKGHDITVVFDGWKSGGNIENQSITGGVRVIYSRLGEKADSVIKRIITSEKKQWIVITSDRDIADHAWRCGSIPLSSEEFLTIFEKIEEISANDFDFLEEDEYGQKKKGNPGRLSKKEKAKRRALNKL